MKRIGVLTSGGDAPGMNAAIRAVVRCGIERGLEVFGIHDGYLGAIENNIKPMGLRSVGGIIQQGGTVLGSARCPEFKTEEGRRTALRNFNQHGIEGLIVIGGNGSQTGSHALHQMGLAVVGVASTIDNDLYGSEITIGVDTALNIALEAIDRLKVTASSHKRAFLVEVMGRDCGYLALMAGLAGGAESILIPEVEITPEQVAKSLSDAYSRGKTHGIIVVAEGAKYPIEELTKYLLEQEEELGFEVRATTLGHVQRGGAPGAFDRNLGTRLGAAAVNALADGATGVLTGLKQGAIATTPLDEIVGKHKPLDMSLYELAKTLAK